MKIIDKTPHINKNGQMGTFQRWRGALAHGSSWYRELEAQRTIIAQLDSVLEEGFILIRNFKLVKSEIVEPIILIGPPGVYVIQVTDIQGFFEAMGDHWNRVKKNRSIPEKVNLMSDVARLARALQKYLELQGVDLPSSVEPVLIASSPDFQVESARPMVRLVLSDATMQFAQSLLQARPALNAEFVNDLAERIITPRPNSPIPEPVSQPLPAAMPADTQASARARAIFQAAQNTKPINPADLSFAFAEDGSTEVPDTLSDTSQTKRATKPAKRRRMRLGQWIILAGMFLVECCVLGGFGYLYLTGPR